MHGVSLQQVRQLAPIPGFLEVFRRGTLSVELYRPRGHDPQTPHQQDELYLVVGGSGTYFCAGERRPFQAGDMLFAAAGTAHRFENFSDDFEVWVIFYGPNGGEQVNSRTVYGQVVPE